MADLNEPAHENKIENKSQNNIFFADIIRANILLIVNVILTDGISILPKK